MRYRGENRGSLVMEQIRKNSLELINLNMPLLFINDFIEYWENIKAIVRKEGNSAISWKKLIKIAQNVLETLTQPIYDKWKDLERLSWIEAYIETFSSIILHFKGASILLPRQLILYEAMKPRNTLLFSLKENPSNEQLERILFSLCGDLNIKLIKSDLQILQKLVQSRFSKSLDRYPKLKELAYGIRRDVRTVSNRLDYLFQHQILSPIYLVDMARIGYQTILIFHNKARSEISKKIQPYIVMSFPLSAHDGFSTILQYPFRDIESYKRIKGIFSQKEEYIINGQYCGWNFSGLTQNPNERWKLLPPILQDGGNWSTRLLIGDTGVEFNLDPYYEPFPLTYRQGRLLGLIHKLSAMEEEFLAKQLKISRAYITKDANELLRNRIIFRFPIFFNLGFGSWIHFVINKLARDSQGGLMNVLEHLKFFPYVNVFYNLDAGTLVGRIRMPPSWTNRFIYSLTSLPQTYPDCSYSYYIGPESYCPWAFDILGTFDWDNYPH